MSSIDFIRNLNCDVVVGYNINGQMHIKAHWSKNNTIIIDDESTDRVVGVSYTSLFNIIEILDVDNEFFWKKRILENWVINTDKDIIPTKENYMNHGISLSILFKMLTASFYIQNPDVHVTLTII